MSKIGITAMDHVPELITIAEIQINGGPPFGQASNNPVSVQIASRRGPRHCGQPGSGEAINSAFTAGGSTAPEAALTVNRLCGRTIKMPSNPSDDDSLTSAAPHGR